LRTSPPRASQFPKRMKAGAIIKLRDYPAAASGTA
jgi:hypothetical protein